MGQRRRWHLHGGAGANSGAREGWGVSGAVAAGAVTGPALDYADAREQRLSLGLDDAAGDALRVVRLVAHAARRFVVRRAVRPLTYS